ncbi:RING-H2 finger protein ATL46-like [Typha angustifolia]|uniref:RING-H2 finger protein ATL46-like n=1 Tax=Typha angustifolia TaxID=59011 RepID=UPI003C2C097E
MVVIGCLFISRIKRRGGVLPHSTHQSSPLPPFPSYHLNSFQRDSLPYASSQAPPTPSSPSSRISPAVLFIIVILAVIFFISGLLHLLVRFLVKKQAPSSSNYSRNQATEISSTEALQRQLQQLFHLHDSGLDQAVIDALPVFLYRELLGPKDPFDCAVCLCEFAQEDKLRLLPVCGHAFHINCIDTWLLSNSTCPLCRGVLFVPGLTIENPMFDFGEIREEEGISGDQEDGFSLPAQKSIGKDETIAEKRVFPVRLGKFRNLNKRDGVEDVNVNATGIVTREEGETSSSNLDARRCYSMGSYQYVLGDVKLKVAVCSGPNRNGDGRGVRGRGVSGNSTNNEVLEGRRICARSKGESFSVSKIWQWPNKKGKLPIISSDSPAVDGSLPWIGRSVGGVHQNMPVP